MQQFNILAGLCSCAGWFESYSVGNPKQGFSTFLELGQGPVEFGKIHLSHQTRKFDAV